MTIDEKSPFARRFLVDQFSRCYMTDEIFDEIHNAIDDDKHRTCTIALSLTIKNATEPVTVSEWIELACMPPSPNTKQKRSYLPCVFT